MIGAIGLGSNLGDREAHLGRGLCGLARAGLEILAVSSVWETEPVDAVGDGWFLNMALTLRADRDPHRVLEALQEIERREGRVREARNGPRTLDLDLLTWGDRVLATERLVLPHPRMWSRRFVLEPLAEVAPGLVNPETGRTVAEEALRLRDVHEVRRIGVLASPQALPV